MAVLPLRETGFLTTTLLAMAISSSWANFEKIKYFYLHLANARLEPVIVETRVLSMSQCAGVCLYYEKCISFNLGSPEGLHGLRKCEATEGKNLVPEKGFNVHHKPVPAPTPTDIEWHYLEVPGKNGGCPSDRGITTVVYSIGDATYSYLDYFICARLKSPDKMKLNKDFEHIINLDNGETCPTNYVLHGFVSSDDRWGHNSDLEGRCRLLENFYTDLNDCKDVTRINDMTQYPGSLAEAENPHLWEFWLHCPYYYYGVGLMREKNSNTRKMEMISMKCCKVVYTLP